MMAIPRGSGNDKTVAGTGVEQIMRTAFCKENSCETALPDITLAAYEWEHGPPRVASSSRPAAVVSEKFSVGFDCGRYDSTSLQESGGKFLKLNICQLTPIFRMVDQIRVSLLFFQSLRYHHSCCAGRRSTSDV